MLANISHQHLLNSMLVQFGIKQHDSDKKLVKKSWPTFTNLFINVGQYWQNFQVFNIMANRFNMSANILVRFAAALKRWKNFFFQEIQANKYCEFLVTEQRQSQTDTTQI